MLFAESKSKKFRRLESNPKSSKRDRCHIIRLMSIGGLNAAKAKAKLKLGCSARTVQRVLKSVDWLSYKKRPAEPATKKRHKAARMAWTSEKELWDDVEWCRVVFSNHKKWNLDGPDGMRCQWTDTRRLIQLNFRRHSGGGLIMMWVGFSGVTKAMLTFLTGRVNLVKYISTLQLYLQPISDSETQVF